MRVFSTQMSCSNTNKLMNQEWFSRRIYFYRKFAKENFDFSNFEIQSGNIVIVLFR